MGEHFSWTKIVTRLLHCVGNDSKNICFYVNKLALPTPCVLMGSKMFFADCFVAQ